MRRLILLFILNIIFLFIFTLVYRWLSYKNFTLSNGNLPNMYDYFILSASVQSGAVITSIQPITDLSKSILSLHLMIYMTMNIIVIYVFTSLY